MRLFLSSSAVYLYAQSVVSSAIGPEKRAENVTLAAPVVAVPSQHWDGTAGTWSSFEIHAGTPQKAYRVMPATSWQETWLIFGNEQERFCNTTLGVPADCAESRGGVFENATSSTWNATLAGLDTNQLILGLDEEQGESGQGIYGFDVVGLGYAIGDGPTLNHSILAEIVSNTWWLGIFGMGYEPTNFSGYAEGQPSFAATMYSEGIIPSKTWSYTAGAFYRLKGVFGSMIFGGYDETRFLPNNVRFTMAPDNLIDIVPSIRQIVSTTSLGSTTLMSSAELVYIDSAIPELWLPNTVTHQFEKAFGLTLDPTYGIYLLNETTHDNLKALNPNITITLGDQLTGGNTVDIILPYAAFDHNITAPLYNGTSFWFPLMGTDNPKLFALGRTFLQEAYVTANFHTRTFNVSQAIFNDDSVPSKIIAIPSVISSTTSSTGTSTSNSSDSPSKKKLGGGAIAGIVIGVLGAVAVVASVIACCLLGWLCFPARKDKQNNKNRSNQLPVHEIDSGKRIDPNASAYHNQASNMSSEVSGQDAKVEIAGNPIMHPQELEADVPTPQGNTPSERVNRPSNVTDMSRVTETAIPEAPDISSLSAIDEQRTPMAELAAQERALGHGNSTAEKRSRWEDHVVSPNSPTMPRNSMLGSDRMSVDLSSPSEATWTPTSPVRRSGTSGSRFQERL